MVHSLIPKSVRIKTTIFENPAKLINHMELTAAVGMAYRQAGLPMPTVDAGTNLKEFRDGAMEPLGGNSRINEKLLSVIRNYVFKSDEVVDEDAQITLKLGYEL